MARKKKGAASQAATRNRAPRRYAPELPPEVLHAIFLPLAGDMRTLCAAACVNTSWQTAALHPRLWRKLHVDRDGKLVAHNTMTDERLAALVRRACGVDAGGKQHKLASLRVTFAPVSLRGVLAALRGPCDDDGEPLLRGALRTLRVAGLPFPGRGANRLIEGLIDFLRPSNWDTTDGVADFRNLDLSGGMTPCTNELASGEVCGRAASTRLHWCEQCNQALCGRCRFVTDAVCEHMCDKCGRCTEELHLCSSNAFSPRYCDCCMGRCCGECGDADPDVRQCLQCAEDGWTWCDSGRSSCHRCFCDAEDCIKHVYWCDGESCSRHYCGVCEVDFLVDAGGEEDEEEAEPLRLCPVCRRTVQPAAEELRQELRDRLKFGYCSTSDFEDEDGRD